MGNRAAQRICRICLEMKSIRNFAKIKNKRSTGHATDSRCKKCRSNQVKEWQLKNPERYLKKLKARKARTRELIPLNAIAHEIYLEECRLRERRYRARKKAQNG